MNTKNRRLLLIFLLSVFALMASAPEAHARRRKKKVNYVVNQILKLEGIIANNGRPAVEFSGIKQGDVLETGPDSYAVIRVPGLGIFRMGPQTQLKMTKFMDRNETKLELIKGELLALYRRVGVHELKSANGVVSPKGATFHLTSRPGEKSDLLCLCDGRLVLPEIPSQAPLAATEGAAKSDGPQLSAESGGKQPAVGAQPSQINSEKGHKLFGLTPKTIEPQESSSPKAHSDSLIQDLESLYALP